MIELKPTTLIVRANSGKTSEAQGAVAHLDQGQRMKRAMKKSGMFVGGALVCLPIPVLHMVLVPTMLLLSVVMGVVTSKKKILVEWPEAKCPECGAAIPGEEGAVQEFPLRIYCVNCRNQLSIGLNA